MADALRKPLWYSPDVEFDETGKAQLERAKAGAAAYRAAHPERYGASPSVTGSVTSVTKSVTEGVTAPKSVTPSVTNVSEAEQSVTVSKGALRAKKWREKRR